jgi:LPS-assembly protein
MGNGESMFRHDWIKTVIFSLLIASECSAMVAHATSAQSLPFEPSQTMVAQSLLWHPSMACPSNLCHGYYYFDPAYSIATDPFKIDQTETTVSSKGPSELLPDGRSILHDDVVFVQKDRKITANKAYVYRDNHTGDITHVELFGQVHDLTANDLIVAPYADIHLDSHHASFHHALLRHHYMSAQDGVVTSWGTATHVDRDSQGDAHLLHDLQYSLCSPLHPSWVIHAKKGHYVQSSAVMKIYQGYLTFHHVPVFYSPYLSIATNNARKSGWLMPKIGYSSMDGFHVGLPYYFNLAPNYDDLLTNGMYTKRGYYLNNEFRWLTSHSLGNFQFYGLPDDSAFGKFKNQTLSTWGAADPSTYPYYNALSQASLTRYSLSSDASYIFNDHWTAALDVHHVSDDYFMQDLSSVFTDGLIAPNQLYNQGSLNYNGQYQQFSVAASGFQTLHPYGLGAANQYAQLGAQDNWFVPIKRLDASMQMDATNFLMPNNLFSTPLAPINKIVNGTRFHARGNLIFPWMMPAGFVRAQLGWDALSDHLFYENPIAPTLSPISGVMPKEVSRVLPIVNIDSGVYLINRHLFQQKNWSSTIEPEVSYLYVPYANQQTIPIFDTTILPLSYDTLYSSNQFLGVDRIQNANQLNLGVKTTLADGRNGFQWLTLGSGTQYYMTLPKVQLTYQQELEPTQQHFSPWVNELTLTPEAALSTTVDWNWNWYKHQTDSATITTNYVPSDRVKLSASYQYLAPAAIGNDDSADLYVLGMTSPIGYHLEAFTYQYYNAVQGSMLASLEGFQYDSCCWALRLAFSHQWNHTDPSNPGKQIYNNAVYVEIVLKGLGNFGSDVGSMLNADLGGYHYR